MDRFLFGDCGIMSNMDILMGFILIIGYVLIACPLLIVPFRSDANYLESVLGGLILTLACLVIIIVFTSVWMAIAYFGGGVRPDTPFTDFMDWVNAI